MRKSSPRGNVRAPHHDLDHSTFRLRHHDHDVYVHGRGCIFRAHDNVHEHHPLFFSRQPQNHPRDHDVCAHGH